MRWPQSSPKEVVVHWILQSSSLSNRKSSVTVLPSYLKEYAFARWVPLTDNGFLTTEFWSARTSVFLQFIVRPNEDAESAKLSMESCNASSVGVGYLRTIIGVLKLVQQCCQAFGLWSETSQVEKRPIRVKAERHTRRRVWECMHEHCSCKYGEKSWSDDASLFNTIIVWDLTGELVVYQNAHCDVSVQALQDSDKFGGTSHFFIMTHRELPFTESNALVTSTKAMYMQVTVLFYGLLHKLSDSKDHIRRATGSSKAVLWLWEHCLRDWITHSVSHHQSQNLASDSLNTETTNKHPIWVFLNLVEYHNIINT